MKTTRKLRCRTRRKLTKSIRRGSKSAKKINRTLHQVYGMFDDGVPYRNIPVFKENVEKTIKFCKKHNIKYKMWNLNQATALVKKHYPEYESLWNKLKKPNPIMRADFIRYCILHHVGGIYIDCDIHPIDGSEKEFKKLFDEPYFFVRWHNDKRKLPYNAILGGQPRHSKYNNMFQKIMEECKRSHKEKSTKTIYKKWKGRFIFHVTGHYMLKRVMNKEKVSLSYIKDILRINTKHDGIVQGNNPIFEDSNASTWYSGKR